MGRTRSSASAGRTPQNRRPGEAAQVHRRRRVAARLAGPRLRTAALALLLMSATVAAYRPAMGGGFIWDDDDYVTENLALRSLEGLRRIWFELGAVPQYYPLVHTTFWIEYRLWGLNASGYHLINVLLHALNALLLWMVLRRLEVPGAWLAAGLFALHPVHVESVAWITERKNVLSAAFYLSAWLAYLRFAGFSRGTSAERGWRLYALSVIFFICALLSKTVTASFPAAVLLLLWWKRGRLLRRDVITLAPLLLLGAAMGLLTAWMEQKHVGAEGEAWELSFAQRCLIAGRALWFYAGKLVWPVELAFIYPRWNVDAGLWWQYLFPAAALAVLASLVILRRRLGRGPLVAVLFFAGTLAPALGFVDVYPFLFSFVADHFQYLASLGLLALVAAVVATAFQRIRPVPQTIGVGVCGGVLLVLAGLTWRQGQLYQDVERLWRDTLAKNPACWMAHNNLGAALEKRGLLDEAAEHYQGALRIHWTNAIAHANLGNVAFTRGNLPEARQHFETALRINPHFVKAHNNLGMALVRLGQAGEALARFQDALRTDPNCWEARVNLADALRSQGRYQEAAGQYSAALRINPNDAVIRNNLGGVLLVLGRFDEAIEHFRRLLRLRPDYSEAHYNLGFALERVGRLDEAVRAYQEALRINPEHSKARSRLEAVLARQAEGAN